MYRLTFPTSSCQASVSSSSGMSILVTIGASLLLLATAGDASAASSHLRRRASSGAASTCGKPIVTTFDADASGTALSSGDVVDESVLLDGGLRMKARRSQRGARGAFVDAMIFDAANPTGNDFDLGTQPQQGNILIISADNDPADPDDAGKGGGIFGTFSQEVTLTSLKVFDIEKGLTIDVYADESRRELLETVGLASGVAADGSVLTLTIGVEKVRAFRVSLVGSGAIDDITFTVPCPPSDAPTLAPIPVPPIGGMDRPGLDAPTMAPVEFPSVMPAKYINPKLKVESTVVPSATGTVEDCPGSELVEAELGTNVTYCFTVENIGDTILTTATLVDRTLSVEKFVPLLQPGDTVTFAYGDILEMTMKNTASATGIPVFADLQPMPNISTPMDSDESRVAIAPSTPECPSSNPSLTKIEFTQDVLGNPLVNGVSINTQSTLLEGMTTVEAIRSQSDDGSFDAGIILDDVTLSEAGIENARGNALSIGAETGGGVNAQGGVYRIKFLRPSYLASFRLWRSSSSSDEEAKDEYKLFTSTGPIYTRLLPKTTDFPGFQTVMEMEDHVVEMRIVVHSESAVDDIYVCV